MIINNRPAILGGRPVFNNLIPLARPTLPSVSALTNQLQDVLETGQLSSCGKYSKELEYKLSKYLNTNNVLAVSNGTTGLILMLKALGLKGKVIVPSFTFSVSVHALTWCGLEPVFADIDKNTFNIDCDSIENLIDEDTTALLCLNCFGVPCDIEKLNVIASKHTLSLVFDSTHAIGSSYKGKKIGQFGNGEVFSTSATKLFTTGEGGFISTTNDNLADNIKLLRNYGNADSLDKYCIGLNGRMSELAAILGLNTINEIDYNVERRNKIANIYRKQLKDIPGIRFQNVPTGCLSAYKDFSIVIDKNSFGTSRNVLMKALEHENIQTKIYFHPPMHLHPEYKENASSSKSALLNSENLSNNIISLPIYSHMEEDIVFKIADAIKRIWNHTKEINNRNI